MISLRLLMILKTLDYLHTSEFEQWHHFRIMPGLCIPEGGGDSESVVASSCPTAGSSVAVKGYRATRSLQFYVYHKLQNQEYIMPVIRPHPHWEQSCCMVCCYTEVRIITSPPPIELKLAHGCLICGTCKQPLILVATRISSYMVWDPWVQTQHTTATYKGLTTGCPLSDLPKRIISLTVPVICSHDVRIYTLSNLCYILPDERDYSYVYCQGCTWVRDAKGEEGVPLSSLQRKGVA